jgi:hypothetical protein
MKQIPLTKEKFATVDDEDYDRVSAHKWCYSYGPNGGYAVRGIKVSVGKRKLQLMHRFILGEPDGFVDHRDGDRLNNQRDNFRLATKAQNGFNRGKNRNNTSGRKGVVWRERLGKWLAQIQIDGKNRYLGVFKNIDDASAAYASAAKELHGEFARSD